MASRRNQNINTTGANKQMGVCDCVDPAADPYFV